MGLILLLLRKIRNQRKTWAKLSIIITMEKTTILTNVLRKLAIKLVSILVTFILITLASIKNETILNIVNVKL